MIRPVVAWSVAASFVLGLVFTFAWAPHPWGWYGIDLYHPLAVELAQGHPFSTLDVPWGYAYFLALFYRLFGPSPAPALVAQVALNALIPLIIYLYAREAFDRRTAALAAVLTAAFSFNTIYASTESSDSVCTFLFVAMVWAFDTARRRHKWQGFALAGSLGGLAAQFRPNLLLVPPLLAAFHLLSGPRDRRRVREGLVVVGLACAMLLPWTVRNFRLTGDLIPTSTHGGQQLWYGTLQTGPYLHSRALNPLKVFETPVFDYTSLLKVPVLVEGTLTCGPGKPDSVDVVYWTDADSTHRRARLQPADATRYRGEIPAPSAPRTISYYFDVRWPASLASSGPHHTPAGGPADPFIYFINRDHSADLDTADALLDIFDLARMLRHIAWHEPVRAESKLDIDRNGQLDEADFRVLVAKMLRRLEPSEPAADQLRDVAVSPGEVRATFTDGSELAVPHVWSGRVTDLQVGEGLAEALMHASIRFTQPEGPDRTPLEVACLRLDNIAVNQPFYRAQPHEMRRYAALASDNIRRDPVAYARSVIYRALRLFIVGGSDDRATTVQFRGSRLVYLAASAATSAYFGLFVFGVFVSWRKRYEIALPLALIVYIPATIAFVLTNMRYTITVQPLMFVFIAAGLTALLERFGLWPGRERAGTTPRL